MSKRYTYSRTQDFGVGPETFSAVEFDSFDEARKAVDRGMYDRKLEVESQKNSTTNAAQKQETRDNVGNDTTGANQTPGASNGNTAGDVPGTTSGQ